MEAVCKLCDKNRILIRSHIIPQFLYKPIFDGTGARKVIEKENLLHESRIRTGIYDEQILCAECDQLINKRYDDYGAKIWNGYRNLDLNVKDYVDVNDTRIQWRQADNADAERFKTFLLSILWRAGISTNEFFDNVDLGNRHSSVIKNFVLSGEPANEYDIVLGHYTINDVDARQFISSINRFKKGSKTYYSSMLAGIQVHWFISTNSLPTGLESFALNAKNGLKILKSPLQGFSAIRHFLGDKAINMPKARFK